MLNPFFTQGTKGEQNLVQELIDEHIKMHGIEFLYLPRNFVNIKTIMREVTSSKFNKAFPIEGYIENYEGFGEAHNLLTKFGVRSTAELQITISQRRFEESKMLFEKCCESGHVNDHVLWKLKLTINEFEYHQLVGAGVETKASDLPQQWSHAVVNNRKQGDNRNNNWAARNRRRQ